MGRERGAHWSGQVGVDGSLHEETAVGTERTQQRDNVGMIVSEACPWADVWVLCSGYVKNRLQSKRTPRLLFQDQMEVKRVT